MYKVSLSCVVDFGNGCTYAHIVCMYIYILQHTKTICSFKYQGILDILHVISQTCHLYIAIYDCKLHAHQQISCKIDKLNGTWAGGGLGTAPRLGTGSK